MPADSCPTATAVPPSTTASPLTKIRALDYVVVFARDMPAMLRFYEDVMRFPRGRAIADMWFEFRVGSSILALTRKGSTFEDAETPVGAAALQLAFRVSRNEVDECCDVLRAAGIAIIGAPIDQPWGHRTLFFRDPDGNIVEIYADL
jgi:catechol 2,3-dioxygenase-like lactoylglutathione lyase family enzyme